jgi:hypothetical protein
MRFSIAVLSTLALSQLGAGCTPTGGSKEYAAPHAPAVTQAELDSDTQAITEQTEELSKLGLEFEVMTRSTQGRVAVWKPSARPSRVGAGSQITALDRYIEMTEKYLRKYQLYTLDGKVQSLSTETKMDLEAKLALARAKLEELRPTSGDLPVGAR